jgi:hypothetical protein
MAKILLVISIVISLLTAGLGFMTKAKVDALQSSLQSTKSELGNTKNTLTKTKSDLDKTTEDLTTANKTVETQKGEIGRISGELQTTKADLEKINQAVSSKDQEIASLKEQITKMTTPEPGKEPITPEQVAELQNNLNKKEAELAELKAVRESLNSRVQESEGRLQTAQNEVKRYQLGIAKQSLTGRVLAVNQGWNFVVLDVGDRQGAAKDAPLLVLRGGTPIARLRITSVEPSTSIADVVPGSLSRGTTVQPGDRVVFAGRQQQANARPGQPAAQPGQPAAQPGQPGQPATQPGVEETAPANP